MKYDKPLQQILALGRQYWDTDMFEPAVRQAFRKALLCGTPELGAEVYGSGSQELIVPHTCKSPACTSCGHRANVQWLRERLAALPDVRYKGITFTMPKILWPFFRDNPRLAKLLPALAAAVIQGSVFAKHGLRVGIVAILHTFNGPLEFNSHVHTMVTAGGLCGVTSNWTSSVYYNDLQLMQSWRRAIVRLLRTALQAGQLRSAMCAEQVEAVLIEREKCSWIIKVQSINSKEHFLKYAGRYVRRPPIAQRRITYIGQGIVRFWAKDKKMGCVIDVECTLGEFLDRWAQHIREHYQHAVRNFGLFSPRALKQTSAAILAILGQIPKPRPKPIPWAISLKQDFGRDPLLLPNGKRMTWLRRLAPGTAS